MLERNLDAPRVGSPPRMKAILLAFLLVSGAVVIAAPSATACDPDHPCDPPPHPIDPLPGECELAVSKKILYCVL